MDIPISSFVASGGVTGAVVVVAFMIYKLCINKRFKSSCCGGSMEISDPSITSPKADHVPKLVVRQTDPPNVNISNEIKSKEEV